MPHWPAGASGARRQGAPRPGGAGTGLAGVPLRPADGSHCRPRDVCCTAPGSRGRPHRSRPAAHPCSARTSASCRSEPRCTKRWCAVRARVAPSTTVEKAARLAQQRRPRPKHVVGTPRRPPFEHRRLLVLVEHLHERDRVVATGHRLADLVGPVSVGRGGHHVAAEASRRDPDVHQEGVVCEQPELREHAIRYRMARSQGVIAFVVTDRRQAAR